jgi:hypothetical protein
MRICSLCEKKHYAKGLCYFHYNRSKEFKEKRKAYYQLPNIKIRQKEYKQQPEYKAKQKEYIQRPDIKIKHNNNAKKYSQKPNVKARSRLYKQTQEFKDKERIATIEKRKRVFNHYGNKCACCGESNILFLSIDHINGGGTKHRQEIGRTPIYRWLIKNNFPEGYQTLCMNCNCAKAWWGKCPHQTKSN